MDSVSAGALVPLRLASASAALSASNNFDCKSLLNILYSQKCPNGDRPSYKDLPLPGASAGHWLKHGRKLTCPRISWKSLSGDDGIVLEECSFEACATSKKDADQDAATQAVEHIAKEAPGLGVVLPSKLSPFPATASTTSSRAPSEAGWTREEAMPPVHAGADARAGASAAADASSGSGSAGMASTSQSADSAGMAGGVSAGQEQQGGLGHAAPPPAGPRGGSMLLGHRPPAVEMEGMGMEELKEALQASLAREARLVGMLQGVQIAIAGGLREVGWDA